MALRFPDFRNNSNFLFLCVLCFEMNMEPNRFGAWFTIPFFFNYHSDSQRTVISSCDRFPLILTNVFCAKLNKDAKYFLC